MPKYEFSPTLFFRIRTKSYSIPPWKRQKAFGLLTFSGGIEYDSVLMRGNAGQRKPVFSHALRSQKQPSEVFLEISQNSQKNTCTRGLNFIKNETLAQMFSCEFFKTSMNTFFKEHFRANRFCTALRFDLKGRRLLLIFCNLEIHLKNGATRVISPSLFFR